MQGFLVLGAAAFGMANAMNLPRGGYYLNTTSTEEWTTSTIYTTQIRTVTDCPKEVTDCPNRPHVTTETIAISTTVCPVTEVHPPKPTEPTEWTTSTVYSTRVYTVTKCPPEVVDCPEKPHVTTETIAVSTTVCPVTEVTHKPHPPHTYVAPPPHHGNLTSTLYTTKHYTISKCPPEVPNCPIGSTTTTIYATGTTCIPQWQPTTKVVPPPQPPVYTKPVEKPTYPEQPAPPAETKPVVPEPEQPAPPAETKPVAPPAETKPVEVVPTTAVPTEPAQVTAAAGRVMIDMVAAAAGVAALLL